MDEITEEEKKIVDELRKRTIKDVTPKMLEDISIFYRFAKARDFNLVEAEDMLRKHIIWRKEMQIDTILTDYEPPEVLVEYAPTSFLCFDKKERLVRFIDCGRADANGLWNVTTKKEFEKFSAYVIEQDIERVIKSGRNLGKPMYLAIDDYEGLTYSNAVSIKTAQYLIHLMKMFIDNYPEVIGSLMVIKAPFYFAWIGAVLKPLLPLAFLQKTRIYGADGWKQVIAAEIDAKDLPECYGGSRTDPDGNPLCKTIIKRGQPIPKSYYSTKNKIKKLSQKPGSEKLVVMPFSKEEITLEIKEENSYLEFEFETKNRNIDFSLLLRGKSEGDFDSVVIIPKQRIDSNDEPEKGCIKCEKVGNYTFVFDNSYSWLHTKEVYYRIVIKSIKNKEILSTI